MFIMLKGFNWHKVTFNLCVVIFFRNSIRPTASHWRPSRHWNWKGICQKRPSHRSLMTCSVLFRNGKQKYLICKSLFTLWFYKMNHASLFSGGVLWFHVGRHCVCLRTHKWVVRWLRIMDNVFQWDLFRWPHKILLLCGFLTVRWPFFSHISMLK